jgi:hypothetical protein
MRNVASALKVQPIPTVMQLLELQGHIDCHGTFEEFLNVDKSVPATTD